MDRFVRTGAVVTAALVAALALTACGSDDKSDSGKDTGSGSQEKESAAPAESGEDSGAGDGDAKSLEGTWAGLSDGKAVALSVAAGKAALVADQHVCQGEVQDMGKVMLSLTCADGNTDRTSGFIKSNDGKTIVVEWDAGANDTLAKTDPGTLPTGLPGLPTP